MSSCRQEDAMLIKGKNVGLLAEQDFEDAELMELLKAMKEAG